MPLFLSLGVSKDEFMESTPKDLDCYIKAEEMATKRRDEELWHLGMYNMSAFSVALSRALSGRKSKAKYMEEPLHVKMAAKQDDENLSEEEKEQERDKLLSALMTMQANFELNHKSGEDK